ncbi:DUF4383 domain-containing protein [Streptomyces aurantiogriseus]|uniref:DUF4383 domain-containing protein n=1 Tax=Streptomyces aurantiogriseus TaxID=66870 RepID=A0A918CM21_9ACTN|nr:DUF4383 domain-containing protein [Streptomyces aurantiogriseus]GGR30307.1 hypothetical protein GCM10010251_52910 [Streptomyces aurantiogriseus]
MASHAQHAKPRQRIRFDEHLPVDHRLNRVYRIGAGLMGAGLLAFGIFGILDRIGFFDTGGDTVWGLNTNGALSWLSVGVGLLLLVGMVVGGNFASTLNMTLGVLFILSGFLNMSLLETDYNFLAFQIQNCMLSFVIGILLLVFGMYGRVGSALPHDNPYWRARHPDLAEQRDRQRELREHWPPSSDQVR